MTSFALIQLDNQRKKQRQSLNLVADQCKTKKKIGKYVASLMKLQRFCLMDALAITKKLLGQNTVTAEI